MVTYSFVQQLIQSSEEEKASWKNYVAVANVISTGIPLAQERIELAAANSQAYAILPSDVIDEYGPMLLLRQKADTLTAQRAVAPLAGLVGGPMQTFFYSASSGSLPGTAIVGMAESWPNQAAWTLEVVKPYQAIAERKALQGTLNQRLQQINPELAQYLQIAEASYQRAKGDNITIDQAISQWRALVQRIWGEIVDAARQTQPRKIGNKRPELASPANRTLVAECLAMYDSQGALELRFEELSKLHQDLSPIAKNPLFSDKEKLVTLHTRAIFRLDEGAALVLFARGQLLT